MISCLRFIGVINAAIWFGSAIYFSFVGGPAIFSQSMKDALGASYTIYSGVIAQIIIERYFLLHYWCGGIAFVHLIAEWLYTGRPVNRITVWVLVVAVSLGLVGGLALQPYLKKLHLIKYAIQTTPAQKEQAAASFRIWHGVSQSLNLVVILGLLYYLWQTANPASQPKYWTGSKFRG